MGLTCARSAPKLFPAMSVSGCSAGPPVGPTTAGYCLVGRENRSNRPGEFSRQGQGKSGGFRSIILFRRGLKAFFVYGFAKRDQDNIRRDELNAFRKLSGEMLMLDDKALSAAIKNRTITEIGYHG